MAGDKVGKGFGFYLMMLILILVAAFLIIVMIMMFSPGKVILGYKYFAFEKSITQTKSTDAIPTDINFDEIDDIIVNASYANVSVTKSNAEDAKDSVTIVNKAKGFAKKSAYTDFEYSVKLSQVTENEVTRNVLNISVKEPQGFLFFSRNVSINISLGKDNEELFEGTTFTITTKRGDVKIGNQTEIKDFDDTLKMKDLSVSTESGDIKLFRSANEGAGFAHTFNSLYLSTASGKITTGLIDITVVNDAKFSITSNGSINLRRVNTNQSAQLFMNNGKFIAEKIAGNIKVLNLAEGTIEIENITGSFDTNKARDSIGKAKIKLGTVNGDLSIPYGNKASITIEELRGQSLINTTSGKISIGALFAPCAYETTSGDINVTIDDSIIETKYANLESLNHSFNSESGNITLAFKGLIHSLNKVRTKANADIKIEENNKFLLSLHNYNYEAVEKLGKKTSIEFIDGKPELYTYPLKVNYSGASDDKYYTKNQLTIYSNGNIKVHF